MPGMLNAFRAARPGAAEVTQLPERGIQRARIGHLFKHGCRQRRRPDNYGSPCSVPWSAAGRRSCKQDNGEKTGAGGHCIRQQLRRTGLSFGRLSCFASAAGATPNRIRVGAVHPAGFSARS